ncbi:YuzF family protein [Bacillus solitudinis]|uniref:YuzF family protein n=1 Tax=Bacillus solitudinis TaxID=2014074 RepID=UPI000C243C88|nr:YuzF family protein [Bacillus solitudinis]
MTHPSTNKQSLQNSPNRPKMVANVDPFIVQTLQTIKGSKVVVETSRGSVRGTLADVKPDYILLEASNASFFVRIQEIVWIMHS